MKTEQLLIAVENMREAINENNTLFSMNEVEEMLQEVVEHLADCSEASEELLIAVENMREAINENNTVFSMKDVESLLQDVVEHLADCSDTELM